MFDLLRKHIEKRVHISDEEFDIISKFFVPKKMSSFSSTRVKFVKILDL